MYINLAVLEIKWVQINHCTANNYNTIALLYIKYTRVMSKPQHQGTTVYFTHEIQNETNNTELHNTNILDNSAIVHF